MVVSPLLSQGFIYPWFPLSFHRGSFTRSILDFGGAQNMNRWMITWCHPVVWEPQGSPGRSAQNLHSSSADCANSAERRIQHLETVTMTFGPPNHKSPCAKSPCGRICCQTDFEIMIIFYIFTIFFEIRLYTWSLLILNHNVAEAHPSFWFRLLLSRPPALPVDFQQVSPAVWGEATLACQHWKGTPNLNLQWKPAQIPAKSNWSFMSKRSKHPWLSVNQNGSHWSLILGCVYLPYWSIDALSLAWFATCG